MNKLQRKLSIISFSYITISLFGLTLLVALTFTIPTSTPSPTLKKQLTGSIFGVICLLGIIAGIFPSGCSRILHFEKKRDKRSNKSKQTNTKETTLTFKGHHPTCGNFSSHVLQFSNKTYCAGCTGLVVGAIASLGGSILYFFTGLRVGESGLLIFWLGSVGVACGLFQYDLSANRGIVRFFLNIIFVLGAFILLVGVNEINDNFVPDFFLLTLIVYWIIARIMLSQLEHKKRCVACSSKSCSYSFNILPPHSSSYPRR